MMGKTLIALLSLFLLLVSCQQRTRYVGKTSYTFNGTAIGIDIMPELATLNLRLTLGLITEGFSITKQEGAIRIKQNPHAVSIPIEQTMQIQTIQQGKWHIATLRLQTNITTTRPISRTVTIEGHLAAHKASPIVMILQEGLRAHLKNTPLYNGTGHISDMSIGNTPSGIKITMKVELTSHGTP